MRNRSDSLLGGHDLDLDAFAVQVIEPQLGTTGSDVVNTSSEGFGLALELVSGGKHTLSTTGFDVQRISICLSDVTSR